MFSKQTLEQTGKLKEQWGGIVAERYGGQDFSSATYSGIPLKPVYTPADIAHLDYERDIGVPGIYPYTRDNYAIHYQFQPWINQQVHGYGLPEHTRERMDMLAQTGMMGYFGGRSYNLVWDVASGIGCDPDDPEAKGYIGVGGVSCVTEDDFDRMFHDIDLTKNSIVFIKLDAIPVLAHYIVYAESQGFPRNKLRGNTMGWEFAGWWSVPNMWSPRDGLKMGTEVIHFCCREMPNWNHTNVVGMCMAETGANAIQQMAFSIGTAITVADECVKAGIEPDAFMPGIGFQISQRNDFFEYIAMFRAWRKMWATIAKERYGCRRPASMHLRVHTHTSTSELTAQQPLVNIVRTTLHALGAMLSGTTAMELPGYDEVLGLPTEEAATLALRTQQVLYHETNIPNVSDPLAGSYFVEWLTKRIEGEGWKLLKQIDEMGGFLKALESGWIASQLRKGAKEWRDKINSGEKVVVGWNKYVVPEEKEMPVFAIDPEVERVAVARISRYKAERDQGKTRAALEHVKAAARRARQGEYGYLMPAAIEAAKAKATMGEITKALREVFDWGARYQTLNAY